MSELRCKQLEDTRAGSMVILVVVVPRSFSNLLPVSPPISSTPPPPPTLPIFLLDCGAAEIDKYEPNVCGKASTKATRVYTVYQEIDNLLLK